MPYEVIPLIASVALAFHHVAIAEASRRSKIAVAFVVAVSLVIWWNFPGWILLATVLQAAAGIYVLVCIRISQFPD